jgi:hypothetical protein
MLGNDSGTPGILIRPLPLPTRRTTLDIYPVCDSFFGLSTLYIYSTHIRELSSLSVDLPFVAPDACSLPSRLPPPPFAWSVLPPFRLRSL